MTLASKVALVTGGSSGLGRAMVTALARAGAAVAFTYRANADGAQALVAEVSPAGTIVALQGDVGAETDVARFIAEAGARFGRLDILVNNAGIVRDSLALRLRPEDWRAVIETNLIGAERCCRHAVPHLLVAGAGRIINIASVAGVVGSAGQANYSAAKAGVIGLTEALGRELGPQRVTVNAVAPGAIDAGIVAGLPEKARRRLLAVIPMGRMGTAEEVAALVVFLAGPQAGFITGQTIVIDGGATLPAYTTTPPVPPAGTWPAPAWAARTSVPQRGRVRVCSSGQMACASAFAEFVIPQLAGRTPCCDRPIPHIRVNYRCHRFELEATQKWRKTRRIGYWILHGRRASGTGKSSGGCP